MISWFSQNLSNLFLNMLPCASLIRNDYLIDWINGVQQFRSICFAIFKSRPKVYDTTNVKLQKLVQFFCGEKVRSGRSVQVQWSTWLCSPVFAHLPRHCRWNQTSEIRHGLKMNCFPWHLSSNRIESS